jgi:hypothetical protein
LPPFQLAVELQQWRQEQLGWRQAGRQLPSIQTAVYLSLPPFQKAVGIGFGIFWFFFIFIFFNTINAK